jgi:hypothetical protein
LGKDTPTGRPAERFGWIIAEPVAGGLHHRYTRVGTGGNAVIQYALPGTRQYQERLYPNPALLDPCTRLKLKSFVDVVMHLTASSLAEDGILIKDGSLSVTEGAGESGYTISFEPLPTSRRRRNSLRRSMWRCSVSDLQASHWPEPMRVE